MRLQVTLIAVALLAGCASSTEEKQKEEATRALIEEAASQPVKYKALDGQATRPLVPVGLVPEGPGGEEQSRPEEGTKPASEPESPTAMAPSSGQE